MGGWLAKANVTVDKHAVHVEKGAVQVPVQVNVSSFKNIYFMMIKFLKSILQISSDPIVMICSVLCITAVYTATATWMFLGVTALSTIGYFGWNNYNNPKYLDYRARGTQISYGQMLFLAWVTIICLAYYFIFHCEFSIVLSNSRISNIDYHDDYEEEDYIDYHDDYEEEDFE